MTRDPRQTWLPDLFSIFCITLLAANYIAPLADLDFTWQIRTGAEIVHTGQLRPVESFSYTIAGRQVPEFEGLYEVLLWAMWTGVGFGGLKLLRTIFVVVPLLLLGARLQKEGVRWYGILLALLVAVFVLSSAWNLRPLYCTTIGLLLVSGWLHDHCQGRRPLTWWLPVTMLLWANLHPGVITGQGLLAGAIAWEWLNRKVGLNRPLTARACWRLTLIGGLGLAATFLSPDPLGRLLYPFSPEVEDPIQRIFVEMQPFYTFLGRAPCTAWVVCLVVALVGLSVVLRFRAFRLWEIALLVGLGGLANLAVRSLQDWLLIMLALGVPQLAALLKAWAEKRHAWRQHLAAPGRAGAGLPALARLFLVSDRFCKRILGGPQLRLQPCWLGGVVALLAVLSLLPPVGRQMPIQNSSEWPVAALDWAQAHGVEGRFFAPPDYGSYLTWRLGSRARCYVDTRGFFFPHELIEDSHFVPQLGPGWRQRLDRVFALGTDYFLLETTGPRGELWRQLQKRIPDPLYCDRQSVLLSTEQVRQALGERDASARPTGMAAKNVELAAPVR